MNARIFDQWMEANRVAWAPVARCQEIAAETAQKAVAQGLAVAQDCVDFGARNAQLLGDFKHPQQWVAEQGKLVSEFGQKMVVHAADYFKSAKETQDSVGATLEAAAKSAAEAFTAKAA